MDIRIIKMPTTRAVAKEIGMEFYADKCLLGDEALERHSITFKQIPYQVRVFKL